MVPEDTKHCSKRERGKRVELWAIKTSLSDLTDWPLSVKAPAVKIQNILWPRKTRQASETRLR